MKNILPIFAVAIVLTLAFICPASAFSSKQYAFSNYKKSERVIFMGVAGGMIASDEYKIQRIVNPILYRIAEVLYKKKFVEGSAPQVYKLTHDIVISDMPREGVKMAPSEMTTCFRSSRVSQSCKIVSENNSEEIASWLIHSFSQDAQH